MEKKPTRVSVRAKYVRRVLWLAGNTILFYIVYRVPLFYAEMTDETIYAAWVTGIYAVLLLGFVSAYLIYNRFLYRKGITPDQLPDSMTDEQKQAFIEDGNRRLEKSKWMMLIILPLVLVFLIDAVQLFIWEPLFK